MKKTKHLRKNDRSNLSKEYSLRGKLHPESVTHCVRTDSGITLIALVITIIVLLILAGVSLRLIAGGNGILGKAEKAVNLTNEATAREKLELVLVELQADKHVDETYNEGKYIDGRINANDMSITDDIVIVDGWKFQIDRSKPEIVNSLGRGTEIQNIKIESSFTCNENFSQATITYIITYDGELKTIKINGEIVSIPEPENTAEGKQYRVTKQVQKNGRYQIYVTDMNDAYKTAELEVEGLVTGYVTDGLMLHYDGIQNTETGHNSGTTIWKDLSGNGRNGTIYGATWGDKYLSFDGVNDWVKVAQMNYANPTVEAVVSSNKIGEAQHIISNANGGGFFLRCRPDKGTDIAFYSNGTYRVVKSPNTIIPNKIYYLSGSYDGSKIRLKENNTIYTTTYSGTITSPTESTVISIGTNPKGSASETEYLNGKVYAVRIYNRALTDEEIQQNYEVDKARFNIDE